ncbi:hypothetical protein ES705_37962 [subsurface metagenome]
MLIILWASINLFVFFSLDRKLERLERQRSLVERRLSDLIKKGRGKKWVN